MCLPSLVLNTVMFPLFDAGLTVPRPMAIMLTWRAGPSVPVCLSQGAVKQELNMAWDYGFLLDK